jgi:hypothetical protein
MEQQGYIARIEYDEEEKVFRGKVANIRDKIIFIGKTPEDLENDFAEQLKFYFEVCKKRGFSSSVLAVILWFFLLGWVIHLWSIPDAALWKPPVSTS